MALIIYYIQRKSEILAATNLRDADYLVTLVTQWLVTQDTDCWQQGTEKLDARQVPEFLQRQYGKIPRGLRREFAVAHFLGMRVRIPPGAWIPVSSER